MTAQISIIILNWNGWNDTIECLESLYQISYPHYTVIVVDNGSADNSLEQIRSYCAGTIQVESPFYTYDPKNKPIKVVEFSREDTEAVKGRCDRIEKIPSNQKIILIKNEKNDGFAKGNNVGIRFAIENLNPDFILLLNNDTVVRNIFLDELVKSSQRDANEKIGIWSPKVMKYSHPSIIDSTGHVFSWGHIVDRGEDVVDRGQYDKKIDVIGAIAAAALYKKEMLTDIGLFDESFFLLYEDAELSWRAMKKNWGGKFVPTSIVYHKRGSTRERYKNEINQDSFSIDNVVTTTNRYANNYQKALFILLLVKTGAVSMIGKAIGRNNIGVTPYYKIIKGLISDKKVDSGSKRE
jgi:GT2 family glycosyltransferase